MIYPEHYRICEVQLEAALGPRAVPPSAEALQLPLSRSPA